MILSSQDATGYILAEDVNSATPFPPFPASIKDGYAVLGMSYDMWTCAFLIIVYNFITIINLIASDGEGIRQVIGPVTAGEMVMSNLKSFFFVIKIDFV